MALLAGGGKLAAVFIAVAGKAGRRQSQKGFAQLHVGIIGEFFLNILLPMTIAAGGLAVPALQDIAGFAVVEVCLA